MFITIPALYTDMGHARSENLRKILNQNGERFHSNPDTVFQFLKSVVDRPGSKTFMEGSTLNWQKLHEDLLILDELGLIHGTVSAFTLPNLVNNTLRFMK
jgi:hypothetical protein